MRAAQFILFLFTFASGATHADWQLNLTPGVSPISHDIYGLHMTILWICVAIGIAVFGVIFYSILHHRKSQGAKPAHLHEHFWLEITWTLIPLLILIVIAIPATRVLRHMYDKSDPDITIKITGHQWKWEYEYMDQGIHFYSNNATPYAQMQNKEPKDNNYLRSVDHPLVLPIHKKIRFLITSGDVIHAWFVPALGFQRDGIPGFINENWTRINRAGTYFGQCNKLCGINHAYMPIVVTAMTETDFDKWVASKKTGAPTNSATNQAPESAATANTASTTSKALSTPAPNANTTLAATKSAAIANTNTSLAASNPAATSTPNTNTTSAASNPAATPTSNANTALPASPTASSTTTTPAASTAVTATNSAATAPAAPSATKSLAELMQQGEKTYLTTCAVCHQPTGEGMPPTFPALKGSKIVTGPIDQHLNRVLNGKPGTAMQAFRDQLSDDEIAAVITYERNSWGNKGETVQADQVKTAKAKPPAAE
jgi:cytochrome c oxidase subunit 2